MSEPSGGSALLPDTSVWVQYLRGGAETPAGEIVLPALRAGRVLTCGPVAAELLAGTSAADRTELAEVVSALPWSELGRAEWLAVGTLAAALRRAGASVPLTDIEIAVAAVSARAELLTFDSDFERIAALETRLHLRRL